MTERQILNMKISLCIAIPEIEEVGANTDNILHYAIKDYLSKGKEGLISTLALCLAQSPLILRSRVETALQDAQSFR
jgi:hypothetical protein